MPMGTRMSEYKDKKLALIGFYIYDIKTELMKEVPDELAISKAIDRITSASDEQYLAYLKKRKENGY